MQRYQLRCPYWNIFKNAVPSGMSGLSTSQTLFNFQDDDKESWVPSDESRLHLSKISLFLKHWNQPTEGFWHY